MKKPIILVLLLPFFAAIPVSSEQNKSPVTEDKYCEKVPSRFQELRERRTKLANAGGWVIARSAHTRAAVCSACALKRAVACECVNV